MIVTDPQGVSIFINPTWLDIPNIAYICLVEDEDTKIVYLTNRVDEIFTLSTDGHDELVKLVDTEYTRRRLSPNQSTAPTENIQINERLIKIE